MPCCVVQIVTAWNGLAIGALARASRVLASEPDQPPNKLFPVEGRPAAEYLAGRHLAQKSQFQMLEVWAQQDMCNFMYL